MLKPSTVVAYSIAGQSTADPLVRRHPIQPSVTSAPEKKPVIETNHAGVSHDAAYSLRGAIHALAERASGIASRWLRTTGTERPACDGRLANTTERPPPRLGGEPGSVVVDGDRRSAAPEECRLLAATDCRGTERASARALDVFSDTTHGRGSR